MKRHPSPNLRKLVLFLLLGSIVNVAVAWGLNLLPDKGSEQSWRYLPGEDDLEWWHGNAPLGFPMRPTGIYERHVFGRRIVLMYEREADEVNTTLGDNVGRFRSGWPCSSMESAVWVNRKARTAVEQNRLYMPPRWPYAGRWVSAKPILPGFAINTLFYAAILWVLFAVPGRVRRYWGGAAQQARPVPGLRVSGWAKPNLHRVRRGGYASASSCDIIMKRRPNLRKLVLFLLLGAIVNVAVAWTAAFFANWPKSPGHYWTDQASDWPTATPAHWPGSPILHRTSGVFWTIARYLTHHVERNQATGFFHIDQYSFGWPGRSLSCERWSEFVITEDPISQVHRTDGHPAHSIWRNGIRAKGDFGALPMRLVWPGFAINTIFYAAILWLLFAAPGKVRRFRGWRRSKRGLCPACAYPVGQSATCTECGRTLIRPSQLTTDNRQLTSDCRAHFSGVSPSFRIFSMSSTILLLVGSP